LERKICFIGTGAIGSAVLERLIEAKFVGADAVFICDTDAEKLTAIKRRFEVRASTDNRDGARFGDAIVLAVPPKRACPVLEEIRDSLSESKMLVSFVALVSTSLIEDTLRSHIAVVRVMPNIASMVGSGFNVFSLGRYVSSEAEEWTKSLLRVLGEYRQVDQEYIEIYSLLSAMGPTYFLPFVDTLIEFGARNGLAHEEAKKAVASTLRGTAELLLRLDRSANDLSSMIGTQPLKAREQELRSALEQELDRTFQQIRLAKERFAGQQG
jgi:pyrroline-5-carboxylate reductase